MSELVTEVCGADVRDPTGGKSHYYVCSRPAKAVFALPNGRREFTCGIHRNVLLRLGRKPSTIHATEGKE